MLVPVGAVVLHAPGIMRANGTSGFATSTAIEGLVARPGPTSEPTPPVDVQPARATESDPTRMVVRSCILTQHTTV
jgi:hypothetical protein